MIPAHNAESQSYCSRTVRTPTSSAVLRRAWAARPGAAILESLQQTEQNGRFSIFAADPVRTITLSSSEGLDPFARMQSLWRPWRDDEPPRGVPLSSAWIGYIAYEAGSFVEPTAHWRHLSQESELARWSLYDTFLICDHSTNRWTAVAVDLPPHIADVARSPAQDRVTELVAWLDELPDLDEDDHGSLSVVRSIDLPGFWDDSPDEYMHRCRRALEYIRAGDVFQVNLSRRYCARTRLPPDQLYARLAQTNPADYAAYLAPFGDRPAIVSSSPELFLQKVGGEVCTRPIKGTRPRTGQPMRDAAARRALCESEKDRAELAMIIDLERNDLSRVCKAGSVRVVNDGEIEPLAHVFHRTATIRGTLRAEFDAVDALRATFPGGSITGAPKVRAMQIIHELESSPRGAYCGAIGFIALNGDLTLNLAIRTLTAHADGTAHFHVGSGIVADSLPHEELAELDAKAVGMLAALASPGRIAPTSKQCGDVACESQPHAVPRASTDGAAAHA